MNVQAIWGMARADFLERTRSYSFLVTLLFAVLLGYETAVGRFTMQLDEYRGVYTSGWIGTLMAMTIASFVSLIGFYIVRNCVERDRATGVGEILAATPISRAVYSIGKWLSNFVVLSAIVMVLAVAAVVMQFIAAEDPHIDMWALLSPFLFLALPAMALTAALALCCEMLPGLRGGVGNVVWFFVWAFELSLPLIKNSPWLDPIGLATIMKELTAEAYQHVPGYHGGIAFQIHDSREILVAEGLRWHGIDWNLQNVILRLVWFGVAIGLVLAASLVFDRFDGTRTAKSAARKSAPSAEPRNGTIPTAPRVRSVAARLEKAGTAGFVTGFLQVFWSELKLSVKGYRWWWYAVAAGLLIAQFASPLSVARGPLLAVAWIWPTLIWSGLATREKIRGMQQVIFSCPNILQRQFPAAWMAGIAVAILSGTGAGLRLLLAGDQNGFVGWLAGAIFVPSLALALGTWSGSSKFFEGLYTALWYIGPINHAPGFDYTGSLGGLATLHYAAWYFAISAALLVAALARRRSQLITH